MESPALFFSLRGRVGQRAFGYAICGVYVLGFLSQVLISPSITARLGMLPFVALQAILIWTWLVLHVKRLRDAAYPSGLAIAIAILYALAIVQFVLLVDPMIGHDADPVGTDAGRFAFADLWTFALLISAFAGEVGFSFFDLFALVVLFLVLMPVVVAIAFSIWSATRRPAAEAPS